MKRKSSQAAQTSIITWLIAGAVAVGFMVLLIIAAANQDFLKSKDLDPIFIAAPGTPVKTRPDTPTGYQIPNRDKKVFDLLADAKPAPAPEPVLAQSAQVAEVAPEPVAEPAPVVETKSEPAPAPVVEIVKQEPAPAPEITPAPAPATSASDWGVQLASFREQNQAANAALKFQQQHAELAGLTTFIERADLGAKGIYYRVKFKGAASSADAKAICDKLKAKGQGCLYGRY